MIFRDTSRFARAIEFLSHRRPPDTSEQHFFHVLEVARILSDATDGKDEDLVISGLLHHTMESRLVTIEELSHHFNESIARLVSELTVLRSRVDSASKSLDSAIFHHCSDRTKMLFAADMVSILDSNPKSHHSVGPHALTEDVWRTANAFAKCINGVNSVLERQFHEVFKLNHGYRAA